MIHDFQTQLDYSLERTDDQAINAFYYTVFKNLERIEPVTDITRQFQGIDKILHLSGGKHLYIDEKKRREVWPDIAVEIYSNYEQRTPGWTFKPMTNYVFYIFMPIKKGYLLPSELLKLWTRQADLARYKKLVAYNYGYKTISIKVPIPELLEGLTSLMVQTF